MPERTSGNYRIYNDSHLRDLRFIRAMQALGFERSLISAILIQARGGPQTDFADFMSSLESKTAVLQDLKAAAEALKVAGDDWANLLVSRLAAKQSAQAAHLTSSLE